jgi:hypothetical protein
MAVPLHLSSASLRVLAVLLSASCSRGDALNDDTDDSPAGHDTAPPGFTVRGTARDTFTREPAAESLCVYVGRPLGNMGGEFEILAVGSVGSGGTYEVRGVVTDSMIGLFMLVQDCADEGTVMPTATYMAPSVYADLGDGAVIAGFDIESVNSTQADGLQGGLSKVGYTGDLRMDGALLGFVLDTEATPVDGAVIRGPKAVAVYYWNGIGFVLTGTVAAAGAMFVVPGAPIYTYTCTDASYTFDTQVVGSHTGYIVRTDFVAM